MNILFLNGSPRRGGNTQAVLQAIQARLDGRHTTEVLDVCALNLSGCRACDACKRNGGHCVCPDDSDRVMQKIARADAVVFGTPVYWWGMSAQMKAVVDKFYSQDEPFHAMRKKAGVVAVGANELSDPQYALIRDQFACITGYLGWELAFALAFSASEPGEVAAQETFDSTIEEAVCRL